MARCEFFAGEREHAVERVTSAHAINPLSRYEWYLGQVYFSAHNYEEMIRAFKTLRDPTAVFQTWYAASLGQAGYENEATKLGEQLEAKAREEIAITGGLIPKNWLDFYATRSPFIHDDDLEHLLEGLRKARVVLVLDGPEICCRNQSSETALSLAQHGRGLRADGGRID